MTRQSKRREQLAKEIAYYREAKKGSKKRTLIRADTAAELEYQTASRTYLSALALGLFAALVALTVGALRVTESATVGNLAYASIISGVAALIALGATFRAGHFAGECKGCLEGYDSVEKLESVESEEVVSEAAGDGSNSAVEEDVAVEKSAANSGVLAASAAPSKRVGLLPRRWRHPSRAVPEASTPPSSST